MHCKCVCLVVRADCIRAFGLQRVTQSLLVDSYSDDDAFDSSDRDGNFIVGYQVVPFSIKHTYK